MTSFAPLLEALYLTGPTASGKSEIGIELARRLDAEIISLDSMAVYREMDIGTAKPTLAERGEVPHHLIDIVDPDEDFSVSEYLALAHKACDEIRGRGRQILFVGGTPLYLKALLRGLTPGPEADWSLRQQLAEEAAEHGSAKLHKRLATVDPDAAAKLHPHDARRIIRALEVYETTGTPISSHQEHFGSAHNTDETRVFVLDWPRPVLHQRINTRVSVMFEDGLVEEVDSLMARFGNLGTAAQALGYREVLQHLEGQWSLPETIEKTRARTRQFARRQLIWFRGLSECRWVSRSESKGPNHVADQLVLEVGDF